MNNTLFLVLAYMLIWIAVFGYVWNILKKQKNLAREVELLKAEDKKSR